jgi:hypothetical protein
MMERIVVDGEGNARYAIEVGVDVEAEPNPLRGVPNAVSGVVQGVADVGAVIAESSREILDAIREGVGSLAPDEVELEFGVSISGESGLPVIAKASAQANFSVRVCWKPGG